MIPVGENSDVVMIYPEYDGTNPNRDYTFLQKRLYHVQVRLHVDLFLKSQLIFNAIDSRSKRRLLIVWSAFLKRSAFLKLYP